MPRWTIAASVTLAKLSIHTTIGNLDNADGWLWNVTDSIYLGLFTWLRLFCSVSADRDLRESSLAISAKTWARRTLSTRDARIETAFALLVGLCLAGFSWLVETVDQNIQIDRPLGERAAISIRWVIDGALFIHLVSMILRHRH